MEDIFLSRFGGPPLVDLLAAFGPGVAVKQPMDLLLTTAAFAYARRCRALRGFGRLEWLPARP